MTTVLSDFDKRAQEIKLYFKLLEKVIEQNASLFLPNNQTRKYLRFDDELQKVMKANVFLLLYNLAESSIKQALIEIYDVITSENVKYKNVKDEIKRIWINTNYRNFSQMGTGNIFLVLNQIADDIIDIEFEASKNISGNIDGRKIREFAENIGFSSRAHYSLENGAKLHLVKTQRNKLAHGDLSFAECGRNYTISDLRQIYNQVTKYLKRILLNIEKYLIDRKYLT
ncbi:MAE_28990/MAE_18760 family HEPN-like nuclease [Neolewinella lacunae]|uniref:MAE-28990/MAE-18760-like HEPN domain-containing protein n=1 Tax=Neolewinella lacunae TaxID=1517758 RepID=A0A923T9L7_9BACT|nr:MAE_28990/MAE_18760 family HEPN-like nuclease [Neolewinella lacunae]MBC6995203.1 hypothetical protein [Neolewinella lacunae]MDN3635488.1 MAE_28990/MAE_18760 family HEPN-like nuclease [Neolewinella lacunae]